MSHDCYTEAEWEAIPDIGDYTIKRKKLQSYAPVPDTLLSKVRFHLVDREGEIQQEHLTVLLLVKLRQHTLCDYAMAR